MTSPDVAFTTLNPYKEWSDQQYPHLKGREVRKRRGRESRRTVSLSSLRSHGLAHSTGEMCLHHHLWSRHPAEGSANSRSAEWRRQPTDSGETHQGAPTQLGFLTFLAVFQRSVLKYSSGANLEDCVLASGDQRLNSSLINVCIVWGGEDLQAPLPKYYLCHSVRCFAPVNTLLPCIISSPLSGTDRVLGSTQ